jgi:hypothetical protein
VVVQCVLKKGIAIRWNRYHSRFDRFVDPHFESPLREGLDQQCGGVGFADIGVGGGYKNPFSQVERLLGYNCPILIQV